MDSATASLKIISFLFVMFIIFIILQFGRGSIGRFLDKRFSFQYLREGGNYKYKNAVEELTYEGNVLLSSFGAVFLLIGIFLSLGVDFFFSYFLSIMVIPYFLVLLRIRTFSDSSILPETGMGYDPLKTYKLTLLASVGLIIILILLLFNEFPFYVYIIGLLYGLFVYLIPIFPDYLGNFVDYEIRSEKGQNLLLLILLLLVAVSSLILLFFYEFEFRVGDLYTRVVMVMMVLFIIAISWKLKKDYNLFSIIVKKISSYL